MWPVPKNREEGELKKKKKKKKNTINYRCMFLMKHDIYFTQ